MPVVPYSRTWVHPAGNLKPFYKSWEDAVNWPRPLAGTAATATFTTKTELTTALSSIASGSYIKYTGTGKLSITSSSDHGYTFNAPAPSGLAVVDFGDFHSGNYVEFSSTATSNGFAGCYVKNPTNVAFVGGAMTCPTSAYGILWQGGSNSSWYDFYVHDVATDGIFMSGVTTIAAISNIRLRGEILSWGQNLSHDSHTNDPGSGVHGIQFSDSNQSSVSGCTIGVYCHDASAGAGIQCGDSPSSVSVTNNTFLMKVWGVDFSGVFSDSKSNAIQLWGPAVQTGNVIEFLQAENITGEALYAGSLTSSSYDYKVKHLRYKDVDLDGAFGAAYDTSKTGITYQDVGSY